VNAFPGSLPALLPAGRPGSEAPHDPRGPWGPRGRPDEPAGGGPEGLREGQNAQEPAIDDPNNRVHRFTISRVHRFTDRGLQGYGVRVFRRRFLFVSRIGSGGSGGGPDPPRGPGARMGRPNAGTGGSGHRSGRMDPWVPRRPDRGAEMNNKPPFVRFPISWVGSTLKPPARTAHLAPCRPGEAGPPGQAEPGYMRLGRRSDLTVPPPPGGSPARH
jgi:hypothetical protein